MVGHIQVAQAATSDSIAFASTRDGDSEIYVMNADGTGQTRLTNNTADDTDPTWSPDRSKIAFTSNRDSDDSELYNHEIYVMNADGTGQTRLTNNTANDVAPAWSPDGTKIAFISNRDDDTDVFVMNPDGSGQTRLHTQDTDSHPTWSPDGTKIAYTNGWSPADINTMNADGTGQTRLTDVSSINQLPAWSPSGSKIAYTSNRDGDYEIYTMNTNGSEKAQLTDNDGSFDGHPSWSPDGSKIIFTSDRDNDDEIYVMNADGSGQTRLTTQRGHDTRAAWLTAPDPVPTPTSSPTPDGDPTVAVTTQTLPDALVGTRYSQTLKAAGGTGSHSWALAGGNLPSGLKLASNGRVSGAPTANGIHSFTVSVKDRRGNSGRRTFTLGTRAMTISTTSLPAGQINKTYRSTKLDVVGGKGLHRWSITSGTLPVGVRLSTSGRLSGRPTTPGTSTFTVQVSDSSNPTNVADRNLTIIVN